MPNGNYCIVRKHKVQVCKPFTSARKMRKIPLYWCRPCKVMLLVALPVKHGIWIASIMATERPWCLLQQTMSKCICTSGPSRIPTFYFPMDSELPLVKVPLCWIRTFQRDFYDHVQRLVWQNPYCQGNQILKSYQWNCMRCLRRGVECSMYG